MLCREREEQRALARAKEAEAEGKLRMLHAHALEFRSKARPVEEYTASDKAEQLQRARQALEGARSRMGQHDAQAMVSPATPLPFCERQGKTEAQACMQVDYFAAPDRVKQLHGPEQSACKGTGMYIRSIVWTARHSPLH